MFLFLLLLLIVMSQQIPSAAAAAVAVLRTSSRTATAVTRAPIPASIWQQQAREHAAYMEQMLYPPSISSPSSSSSSTTTTTTTSSSLRARTHAVRHHPVYNFLHTYYRYSAEELMLFSAGIDVPLELVEAKKEGGHVHIHEKEAKEAVDEEESGLSLLNSKFLCLTDHHHHHHRSVLVQVPTQLQADGRYGWIQLSTHRDILVKTQGRAAHFGCFGYHEWAMLYKANKKHQEELPLRVSQQVIDQVVEEEGNLKCTHFDAWRFFDKQAQPLNVLSPLTRADQQLYEQPGCIHATMDLFKYAYKVVCTTNTYAQYTRTHTHIHTHTHTHAAVSSVFVLLVVAILGLGGGGKKDRHARIAVRRVRLRRVAEPIVCRDKRRSQGLHQGAGAA